MGIGRSCRSFTKAATGTKLQSGQSSRTAVGETTDRDADLGVHG